MPKLQVSDHIPYIHRCITLAQQAAGRTAPNPLVGSVIVKNGQIIGEGYHPQAGQPHAEIFALKAAAPQANGATLYVNLEPCNHHGRTPPCTEAIIAAGISHVVIGMVDPDPRVSGSGIARLRQAGITVTTGIEETACQQLNEGFIHRIYHQRPFGIWKYAMTLDGKIATTTGHSAWITSPEARRTVHQLRGTCDAIIVGGNTVRQDNPNLTCHGECDRTPQRIVISRQLNLPAKANLWQTENGPTTVFTSPQADPNTQQALTDQGVEVITLSPLTPDAVMANLYERGCATVLWECGGELAAVAIAAGSVQKIWAFIAPKLIGGKKAPTPLGELGLTHMGAALPLTKLSLQQHGPDYLIEGYL
jgi:diaminohydroxyphosphoribosylaminopyrimidine deaminase/5-amino-6-(5-phosphoribosylamino)uracil reductase